MKLSDALFKIVTAGALGLAVTACGTPANEPPPPPVTSVTNSLDASNFANQMGDLPNGVYKVEINGAEFGAQGTVPCVALKGYHRSGWGNAAVGGAIVSLSCNWDAAGKGKVASNDGAVPETPVAVAAAPAAAP